MPPFAFSSTRAVIGRGRARLCDVLYINSRLFYLERKAEAVSRDSGTNPAPPQKTEIGAFGELSVCFSTRLADSIPDHFRA